MRLFIGRRIKVQYLLKHKQTKQNKTIKSRWHKSLAWTLDTIQKEAGNWKRIVFWGPEQSQDEENETKK